MGADTGLAADHVQDAGDRVARAQIGDLAANFGNDAADIPAEPDRVGQSGQRAHRSSQHPDVDGVDRGGSHPDPDVGRPELLRGDLFEDG